MTDEKRSFPEGPGIGPRLERLAGMARNLGADASGVLDIRELPLEPDLVRYCRDCRAHGLGAHCPPHATDPETFRARLSAYTHVVVFKIDVPLAVLVTDAHLAVTRRIHAIAAALERDALLQGATAARSLASGSCKLALCGDHDVCSVLAGFPCRHPGTARASVSAFGIHMFRLAERLGWPMRRVTSSDAPSGASAEEKGLLAGLLLVAFPP